MAGPLDGDDYTFTYRQWEAPRRKVGETSWSYKTTAINLDKGSLRVERVQVIWDGYKWVEIEPEPKEKAAPTNEYGPVEI